MSFIQKMLCCLLIFARVMSYQIQELNIRDEQGRTSLMNFVIEKEAQILQDTKDLKTLWDTYFYRECRHEGYTYTGNGIVALYKYVPTRRIYTTDADVVMYKQKEQDLANFVSSTIKSIRIIVQSGVDINAKDYTGYTVQNYCYSEEIYNELRRLGADFQYCPWVYFNPTLGTLATTGAIVGMLMIVASAKAHIAHAYDADNRTSNYYN